MASKVQTLSEVVWARDVERMLLEATLDFVAGQLACGDLVAVAVDVDGPELMEGWSVIYTAGDFEPEECTHTAGRCDMLVCSRR